MLSVLSDINWLAGIASTLLFAVLGGLYFTTMVPGPYKAALGNEERELGSSARSSLSDLWSRRY